MHFIPFNKFLSKSYLYLSKFLNFKIVPTMSQSTHFLWKSEFILWQAPLFFYFKTTLFLMANWKIFPNRTTLKNYNCLSICIFSFLYDSELKNFPNVTTLKNQNFFFLFFSVKSLTQKLNDILPFSTCVNSRISSLRSWC